MLGPSVPTDAGVNFPSRVAVTGASGFVGRRLLHRLKRDRIDAVAISRRRIGMPGVAGVVIDSYDDVARLATALMGVDVVVHLAARAHESDHDSMNALQRYQTANVATTMSVARASRLAGVKRLVFVSSIGVNGNCTYGKPFSSADGARPVEVYAKSKWMAEQALAVELASGPTDFTILRSPLIYGPGCVGNFERLVRWVARSFIVPLGALNAPRTFIYVDNLIDALMVATRHPGVSRRTFLVADERDVSVGEAVRILAMHLGRKPSTVWNVPTEILRSVATMAGKGTTFTKLAAALQVDGAEFCRVTGWRPPFDPQEGLRLTAQHVATSDS